MTAQLIAHGTIFGGFRRSFRGAARRSHHSVGGPERWSFAPRRCAGEELKNCCDFTVRPGDRIRSLNYSASHLPRSGGDPFEASNNEQAACV